MSQQHPNKPIELIARGVVRCGSSILLCRNVQKGYFYLPGGHVEPGEPAAAALEREFLEETGLSVSSGPLLAVAEVIFHDGRRARHEVNLVFHVEQGEMLRRSGAEGKVEDREEGPPAVRSLEPEIAFEWRTLGEAANIDLRPRAIRGGLIAQMNQSAPAAKSSRQTTSEVFWFSAHE